MTFHCVHFKCSHSLPEEKMPFSHGIVFHKNLHIPGIFFLMMWILTVLSLLLIEF